MKTTRQALTLRFRPTDLQLAKQILLANGRSDDLKAEFKHIILNVLNAALTELKKESTDAGGNAPGNSEEARVSDPIDSGVPSGEKELLDTD